MLKYADDHPGFGTYIMRPAMILTRLMSLRNLLFSFGPSVKVDELSRTMLDLALNGAQKNIWENADMKQQHVS
jgi:hypothetical protein